MSTANPRSDDGVDYVPPGGVARPLPHVIDMENFTPRLLALLSNRLVWRESRALRAKFGLGTNDWRLLAALAVVPGSSSSEVADDLAINKAIVSKSVNTLMGKGLIVQADVPGKPRPLYLTEAGVRTHDEMLPISLSGQDVILAGLSADEIDRLNAMLRDLLFLARKDQAAGDPDTDL